MRNNWEDLDRYIADNDTGYDDSPGLYVKDEEFETMLEDEYSEGE